MIRMVVSDIDGTLLPDGTDQMNPKLYNVIRQLKEKDIIFVAASGRQYASMRYVFAPVAEDIIFIAENGSVIMQEDKPLHTKMIDAGVARRLVHTLREVPQGEIMLSTPESLYFEVDGEAWKRVEEGYHSKNTLVQDVLPYCQRTNKITIYRNYDIDVLGAKLREQFGDELNVVVAGKVWVDFMNKDADKGTALRDLQNRLGITPDETMAFGDNCNDIGMLSRAAESYAVANAHPQLKEKAKYVIPSYEEEGVIAAICQRLL